MKLMTESRESARNGERSRKEGLERSTGKLRDDEYAHYLDSGNASMGVHMADLTNIYTLYVQVFICQLYLIKPVTFLSFLKDLGVLCTVTFL